MSGQTVFKTYCCTYRHDGFEWGLNIQATSSEDARQRLKALGAWGKVDGELVASIPSGPGVGFIVRFAVWVKNIFGGANG